MDSIYEVIFDEEFVGGLKLRCSNHRGYRMSASALMNISYGSRRGAKSEKPLAVVKPQQNEIRFFNPTSTAPHTQEQQWYANKINKLGISKKESGEPPSDTANRTGARKKSSAPSSRVSFSLLCLLFTQEVWILKRFGKTNSLL